MILQANDTEKSGEEVPGESIEEEKQPAKQVDDKMDGQLAQIFADQ